MASSPCNDVVAPKSLSYFTASCSGLLSLCTILGNLAVCLAVYKDPYKKLRTPFMYFLVNLSLSDLVVGCITLPTSVATHTMEAIGTKEKEHVDLILVTFFISTTASLLSLAALCVDRYFAVAFPMKYRINATFKKCIIVSALIWVVSTSLPFLYFITGYMTYLMIFAHTGVVTAMIILVFTYFKVFKLLRDQGQKFSSDLAQTRNDEQEDGQNRNYGEKPVEKDIKMERKVTRVFIIILSVFAACYIPVIIMIYILKFCLKCDCTFRHILRDAQFLMAMLTSAVNPFICTLRLQPFRLALMKIFGLRRKQDSYTNSSWSDQSRAVVLKSVNFRE